MKIKRAGGLAPIRFPKRVTRMSEERIVRLEEALAYQEEQVNALSKMVVQQWDEIELLKKHIRKLQSDIDTVSETADRLSNGNEKPPHY